MDNVEQAAQLLAQLYLERMSELGDDSPRLFSFGKWDFYSFPGYLGDAKIIVVVKVEK